MTQPAAIPGSPSSDSDSRRILTNRRMRPTERVPIPGSPGSESGSPGILTDPGMRRPGAPATDRQVRPTSRLGTRYHPAKKRDTDGPTRGADRPGAPGCRDSARRTTGQTRDTDEPTRDAGPGAIRMRRSGLSPKSGPRRR
jgi:hypothetical protein